MHDWRRGGRAALVLFTSTWITCSFVSNSPALAALADGDGDGLPDAWEIEVGLNPASASGIDGRDGDPDGDGLSNAAEFAAASHPRGFHAVYFAEGVANALFGTRFSLFNDENQAAHVLMEFDTPGSGRVTHPISVPAFSGRTIDATSVPGLTPGEFAAVIESDVPVVADRTVEWGSPAYGSHRETAMAAPARRWILAEGATHSGFSLFYVIHNPSTENAAVDVAYLLPTGTPITKRYLIPARRRFTLWVNHEDARLAATDVSAIVTADRPILVERAMYRDAPGLPLGAGHAAAGVTSVARRWYFAEGATGPFFDCFLLLANPNASAADVRVKYLLPDGAHIERAYTVAGSSRRTVWVDYEDPRLADTPVGIAVESVNAVGIVAERSMWWPGPTPAQWTEAHASRGTTIAHDRWVIAGGELPASGDTPMYVLIASPTANGAATVVTLAFEDGTSVTREFMVEGYQRLNLDLQAEFPQARDRRFGIRVQTRDRGAGFPLTGPVIVEVSQYGTGQGWPLGTRREFLCNTDATRCQGAEAVGSAQLSAGSLVAGARAWTRFLSRAES